MARKRFGQHFLVDQTIIQEIAAAIAPQPDDALLEIGPGRGALTRQLLQYVARLDAIEIDRDLIAGLDNNPDADAPSQLHLVGRDALDFDYAAHASERGQRLRLAGNLAYNMGTPLIFHVLQTLDSVADMHFMLQKEVVDRIVAAPGDAAYGRLSVSVAVRARAYALFDVDPTAFRPKPAVTSAVVRIVPNEPSTAIANQRVFDSIVADAFSKRRKTCRNALARWVTADSLRDNGIDPQARPGELTPNDYIRLANTVSSAH